MRWWRGVAFIALALGNPVGEYACAQQAAHQGQRQPTTNNKPIAPPSIQDSLQRISRTMEAAENGPDAQAEKERAKENLQAQRNMARWAFGAMLAAAVEVLISAVGILLIWRTLVHTRNVVEAAKEANKIAKAAADESLAETRRIGEAQTRAYISVSKCFVMFKDGKVDLRVNLRNSGQSPALQVRWHATVTFMVDADTGLREGETSLDVRPIVYDVAAQGEREALYCSCENDFGLGPVETAGFRDGKPVNMSVEVWAYGQDVFGGKVEAHDHFLEIFNRPPEDSVSLEVDLAGSFHDDEEEAEEA